MSIDNDKFQFVEQLISKGLTENKPSALKNCIAVVKEKDFYDGIESDLLLFIVKAKIIVTIALAVHEKNALSHTPLSCHIGVRINKKPIGNTSVPKKDVIRERAGRSSAVK